MIYKAEFLFIRYDTTLQLWIQQDASPIHKIGDGVGLEDLLANYWYDLMGEFDASWLMTPAVFVIREWHEYALTGGICGVTQVFRLHYAWNCPRSLLDTLPAQLNEAVTLYDSEDRTNPQNRRYNIHNDYPLIMQQ